MKLWRRALTDLLCGAAAGCTIRQGEAYLELRGHGEVWVKVRCRVHAGEAVPAVIAEDRPVTAAPRPVLSFTGTRQLSQRFDVKRAQSGDDAE